MSDVTEDQPDKPSHAENVEYLNRMQEDAKARKLAEKRARETERMITGVCCVATALVTATVTWKFTNARALRKVVKTAYALGQQAGERERELEIMLLDHVEFLDANNLISQFGKIKGYTVELDLD